MRTISLIVFILLANATIAQRIISCGLFPATPQKGDPISLVVDAMLPSSGCWIVNSTLIPLEDGYSVEACYGSGMLTAICNRKDTLPLGILKSDSLSIDFKMWYSQSGDPAICSKPSLADSAKVKYQIPDTSTSVSSFRQNQVDFLIFPNPISDHMTIRRLQKSSISRVILTFYDVYLVETKKVVLSAFNEEASVALDNIGLGISFLKIETDDQVLIKKICLIGK